MYVGRIVAIGRTKANQLVAMYRVSSRSFPNREMVMNSDVSVSVVPKKGSEGDMFKNPYIAYNCLKVSEKHLVVTNGSHTDFVFEKLQAGLDIRDALTLVLLSMDYEHDSLNTPRIAAAADLSTGTIGLGIVRKDGVLVRTLDLKPGETQYIATYEHNYVSDEFIDHQFDANNAQAACDYIIGKGVFAELTLPIAAASVIQKAQGPEIGFINLK